MVPFRVYNREKKEMWVVVNQLVAEKSGQTRFLCAKEDNDAKTDGIMKVFTEKDLLKLRFVDFIDDTESVYD